MELVAEERTGSSQEKLRRKGNSNESSSIGKKDLREVQGHYPPRCGEGDLRERKAQAAPGLSWPGTRGNLHDSSQFSVVSSQLRARQHGHRELITDN